MADAVADMIHEAKVDGALAFVRELCAWGEHFPPSKYLNLVLTEVDSLRSRLESAERDNETLRSLLCGLVPSRYTESRAHGKSLAFSLDGRSWYPCAMDAINAELSPSSNQGKTNG